MVRGMVTAAAVLLLAATSADAGLFSRSSGCGCAAPVVSSCGGCNSCDDGCGRRVKVRRVKHRGCCAPVVASCGAPAPSCCAPAAPVCAPAPAPTCCAPSPTCCAPAAAACNSCAPVATCAGGHAAPAGIAPAPPANGALAEPPKPQAVDTPAPPAN